MSTFRILTWGGLGDVLLMTPSIRELRRLHPESKIKVFCVGNGAFALLRNNPYIDSLKRATFYRAPVEFFKFWVKTAVFKRRLEEMFIHPAWGRFGVVSYDVGHATEIIGEFFGLKVLDRKLDMFLTEGEESEARQFMSQFRTPVVIQITGACSANKSWYKDRWEELVRRNSEYTFIQLGHRSEEKIEGALDLRGQTSIRKSIALLKYAAAFVGVESFLGHATNAVGTLGVVLFGPSAPHAAAHPNNVNVTGDLPRCAPCLDRLLASPCPYNKSCMLSITVEVVERALRTQVRRWASFQEEAQAQLQVQAQTV